MTKILLNKLLIWKFENLTPFIPFFPFLDPIPMSMLIMYKNVPVVTICWVTFFAICFLIFLVLSLCSESHCSCCRCLKCCREGTATVARIPSMVTTTYSSRDSLHHSLMRAGGQCDQIWQKFKNLTKFVKFDKNWNIWQKIVKLDKNCKIWQKI